MIRWMRSRNSSPPTNQLFLSFSFWFTLRVVAARRAPLSFRLPFPFYSTVFTLCCTLHWFLLCSRTLFRFPRSSSSVLQFCRFSFFLFRCFSRFYSASRFILADAIHDQRELFAGPVAPGRLRLHRRKPWRVQGKLNDRDLP